MKAVMESKREVQGKIKKKIVFIKNMDNKWPKSITQNSSNSTLW